MKIRKIGQEDRQNIDPIEEAEWISVPAQGHGETERWPDRLHYLLDSLGRALREMEYVSLSGLAKDYNGVLPEPVAKIVRDLIGEYERRLSELKKYV